MSGLNMRCAKAQRLFSDLADDRLPDPVALELRRHLDECTDCRVAHQRAARLQQLLALKRHERPSQEYFGSFLAEFHQRLEAETRPQAGWWEGLVSSLRIEIPRVWRYGLAGGLGAFVIAGTLVLKGILPSWQSVANNEPSTANPASILTFAPSSTVPSTAPMQFVDSTSYNLGEPAPAGGTVTIPAVAQEDASAPRYVLDRITVTPVNYELASSIRF